MRSKNIILLDDEKAKKLSLTSDKFSDAFVWDCRPSYLGITRLEPLNQQALIDFFNDGKKIYSTIRICAPNSDVIKLGKEYGYELKYDRAGLPYLTDEASKTLSRQHIKELTQKVQQ